ncbi:response regulator transcription factor [Mesorhizobium xinjiangense]|uniref:response regulator transcription factor n=1 Tax=Mesorhizobium xinjiangense TaxID=2678685 RepID=UPI0022A75DBA|nr:response regulator transcription factor [Mesorhizobium xinjiangense]
MSTDRPLVIIVDDDPSMRMSIESLLRSVGHAVQSFASTQEFMQGAQLDAPGCLVLDIRLPGRSGLEFQRELASREVELPIVFITGHGDVPMSVAAMKAGAIEFLTKPFRDQDLLDAVHRGLELDSQRRSEAAMLAELSQRRETLTPREREVMALVVAGRLNKQIAAELDLSEATVKVHRAQVMRKMEAKSLPDLVRFADSLALDTTRS